MRVPLEKYSKLPEVGSTVIVRYEVYGPGVITMSFAKDVRVYNTTINSHPGMGIYGSNTENILIDGLHVVSKTKELFMSATADATHFNCCRGRIDILNSKFEKMGDDATNVHQMYWVLEEKQSPQKITVVWGKQKGHARLPVDMLPRAGDTIGFGAQDIRISNCTFKDVNFWGAGREGAAILDAAAFSKGTRDKGPVNGTTLVENCTFTGCGTDPIMLTQTQTPIIKDNVIEP